MNKLIVSIFAFSIISLSSCSNYILKTHNATAIGVDGQEYREIKKNVYWWGIVENRAVYFDSICGLSQSPLSEVRVKKSAYQTLLGIVTFGIVNRSTIEYSCGQN